jgi:hypothetical protein
MKEIDHFRGLGFNRRMQLKVMFGKWSMTWHVVAFYCWNKQFALSHNRSHHERLIQVAGTFLTTRFLGWGVF